ncbi:hypothetical protein K1719_034912 [Acacia pycnantha]|nr:hypothetical protein K1719_034912 [Acacia pycnantha]
MQIVTSNQIPAHCSRFSNSNISPLSSQSIMKEQFGVSLPVKEQFGVSLPVKADMDECSSSHDGAVTEAGRREPLLPLPNVKSPKPSSSMSWRLNVKEFHLPRHSGDHPNHHSFGFERLLRRPRMVGSLPMIRDLRLSFQYHFPSRMACSQRNLFDVIGFVMSIGPLEECHSGAEVKKKIRIILVDNRFGIVYLCETLFVMFFGKYSSVNTTCSDFLNPFPVTYKNTNCAGYKD